MTTLVEDVGTNMNTVKLQKIGSRAGFTIVETMIVLAVTAVMFISVVLVINGKQQTAEFNSALSDLRTQLQQTGNDVANGVFPDSDFGCRAMPVISPTLPIKPTLSSAPDNNGQCMYIGKVVHFYSPAGGSDASTFSIYSIIGNRQATSYGNARMLLVAKTNALGSPTVERTTAGHLQYGLTVDSMKYTASNAIGATVSHDVGSFGFVQSINSGIDLLDATSRGASQHSQLLILQGNGAPAHASSQIDNDQATEAARVNELLDPPALAPSGFTTQGSVSICVKSGTTNQWASIQLSNGKSQLDIDTKIANTKTAACGS